jgi:uncharacterized protein YbaR (Trm112 family)
MVADTTNDAAPHSLRAKMLEFLVCPACLGRLAPLGDSELVCRAPQCRRSYGIIHGRIANLVAEEAAVLDREAWEEKLRVAGLPAREPDDRRPDRRRPKRRRERGESGTESASRSDGNSAEGN